MALLKKNSVSTATSSEAKPRSPRLVAEAAQVLLYPLVTEKAARLASINQYVFAVARRASKIQIIKAVEARYGVKPKQVTVMTMHGKKVRAGQRGASGQRRDWRKAIVTLPVGQKLILIEGV